MSEKTRPWQENEVVYSVGAGRFNDGEEVVVSGDGFETSILGALRFLFPPFRRLSEYPWVRCPTARYTVQTYYPCMWKMSDCGWSPWCMHAPPKNNLRRWLK